jgi:hypothetical protein
MIIPKRYCAFAAAGTLVLAAVVLAAAGWSGSRGQAVQQSAPAVQSAGAGPLSSSDGDSDYPSTCSAPDGSVWAVWQTYSNGGDRLFVSHFANHQWTKPVAGPGSPGDLYKPACGVDGGGTLWVVWSRQEASNWDLWSSAYARERWSKPEQLTNAKGADFAPRLTRAPDGPLVLVWQAWRNSGFDILLSELKNGRWTEPELVTANAANDWAPDVTVAPNGVVSVAWDSYRNGDYDVFLRQKKDGGWGPEIPIAAGSRFEAYSSVASDSKGVVWIAYEERTEKWGKDRGLAIDTSYDELDTLTGYCRVRVRCLKDGKVFEPAQPPRLETKPYDWGGDHAPRIVVGGQDRIWLAFRRPTITQAGWGTSSSAQRKAGDRSMIPIGVWWNNYAIHLNGGAWSAPSSFGDTGSRIDSDMAAAPLPGGGLLGVWHSDSRKFEGENARFPQPGANRVYASSLPAPQASNVAAHLLAITDAPPAIPAADAAKERRDVERVRNYTVRSGGRTYRLYRGDLHRHTDISWDGPSDASITDMYRYALDAVALDFVAPTDHNQFTGVDLEYVLWRTQKIVDIFNAPPHFVALYGYERSLGYPNGHRNVIEAKRGFASFPRTKKATGNGVADDDTRQLFAHVAKSGGITIPHETGEAGTVWRDKSAVEPLVEIYQGCRHSYECEGAPRTDSRLKPRNNYFPGGFVWEAWKKGFRLGVIASSDHQSTHISYANVFATEATRESLIEAMKQRHTFGSTDNLVLDFRTEGHLQGDDFASASGRAFHVEVLGTAPIKELVIIRNFQVVYSARSATPSLSIDWKDTAPAPGGNHYYVRVLQSDGELGWSSPIWVSGN